MDTLLEITGSVERPASFSFEELEALDGQVPDVAAEVPGREGSGVRLTALLAAVKPTPEAAYLTLATADRSFSASVPLDAVKEQGIVVYRLGDAPLPEPMGGPVRFYIADVEACGLADGDVDRCANVKYLRHIEIGPGKGKDTRPATVREHQEIHPHSAEG